MVYNFCSGPAVLPPSVLTEAQQALVDWQGTGTSILSIGHRSDAYLKMVDEMLKDFRELLGIPSNYKILMLQGGAAAQFSMLPLNLLGSKRKAAYVNTGYWSERAILEAKRYGDIQVIASGVEAAIDTNWPIPADVSYVHCTPNETIHGIEFTKIPQSSVPIIGDLSSTILSRPINVSDYGVIYAGAQKNIGPAGVVFVIIREDLIIEALPGTPTIEQYTVQAKNESLYNTPPTFAWYVSGLVFKWLKREGGVKAMAELNQKKSQLLYQAIDRSHIYSNSIPVACRSWMNIPFRIKNQALEPVFLKQAEQAGLINLQGHRVVGGLRASLYNPMPLEGVQALVDFMQEFEKKHG
jgi:phosphoserine aminotransferase